MSTDTFDLPRFLEKNPSPADLFAALPEVAESDFADASHRMQIMAQDYGDVKQIWDAENEDEVDAARRTFDYLISKGYYAYRVNEEGDAAGQAIREFDPQAERIILRQTMVGG